MEYSGRFNRNTLGNANPHKLPQPVQWYIVISAGILPGLLLLAMVQSRYEAIRLPGWAVLFLWAAFLVYVAPRLLY